jgi:hypothetical protein
MAEWSIAAVLKTVVPQGTGGSNPSFSAPEAEKPFRLNSEGFFAFVRAEVNDEGILLRIVQQDFQICQKVRTLSLSAR